MNLPPLFGYGFRPFFLAAGLMATLSIPWWVASIALSVPLATAWPATLWHGHEMVFGFIVAALSGFLLTAVPSWTGQRGFAGWPLVLLTTLWLIGRLLVASSRHWPPLLTAAAIRGFKDAGIARMAMSLDGADAATHDDFRGIPGTFDRAMFALEEAQRIGLDTQLQTTVTRRLVIGRPRLR